MNADVIQHREGRNLGCHLLFGIRPTMERGIIGSRRGNVVEDEKRSRDAPQLGEHLLCKQPVLNAVVYRTGTLLKTPQLSAVINPHPTVQFHHQSRCLDDLPEASLAGELATGTGEQGASLRWS